MILLENGAVDFWNGLEIRDNQFSGASLYYIYIYNGKAYLAFGGCFGFNNKYLIIL